MDWKKLDNLIFYFDEEIKDHGNEGFGRMIASMIPFPRRQITWAELWAKAAEIREGFRAVRYPTKQAREDSWQRFHALCSKLASRREKTQYDLDVKSSWHRDVILKEIEDANPYPWFGASPDHVEMKRLGTVLKEAGQLLSQKKQEMTYEHKQQCFQEIVKMRELHDSVWKKLKEERNEDWLGKKQDYERKIKGNLEKNIERRQKAVDALENCKSHAEKLRSQIESAWSDNFQERAEEWLSETENKISDIENWIETLDEWIAEGEEKLNQL